MTTAPLPATAPNPETAVTVTQDPGTVAAEIMAGVPVPETGSAPAPAAPPADPALVDRNGHVFRPGFHRVNPDGSPYRNDRGLFMPRGGRKPGIPNKPKPGAPTPAAAQPAQQTAPLFPDEPEWSDADRAAALAGEPTESAPQPPTPAASAPAPQPASNMVSIADEGAEVGCRTVYTVAGFIFDDFDACEPAKNEHENMRKSLAAYIRSKGWTATAGWGILLMFAAYILRTARKPGPSKRIRAWMAKRKEEKPVTIDLPTAAPTVSEKQPATRNSVSFDNIGERPAL